MGRLKIFLILLCCTTIHTLESMKKQRKWNFPKHNKKKKTKKEGSIYFVYGPECETKTVLIEQLEYAEEEKGKKVMAFVHDEFGSKKEIETPCGKTFPATPIALEKQIENALKKKKKVSVVGIDGAQNFSTMLASVVDKLRVKGYVITVAMVKNNDQYSMLLKRLLEERAKVIHYVIEHCQDCGNEIPQILAKEKTKASLAKGYSPKHEQTEDDI